MCNVLNLLVSFQPMLSEASFQPTKTLEKRETFGVNKIEVVLHPVTQFFQYQYFPDLKSFRTSDEPPCLI